MSYHGRVGLENAREFGGRCRAWFAPGGRLLWVESCVRDCGIPAKLVELGERRGFPVAVLEGSVWAAVEAGGEAERV